MRFMVMVRATSDSEAGVPPSAEMIAAMGRYNEELARAGVMLAGDGLQPSSRGARVKFSGGRRTVIDGPFTETKELIAGYWLWQASSLEEAIDWVKRCPEPMGEGVEAEIEIRPLFEVSDFPADVMPPEQAARQEALRKDLEGRKDT
ncbi:MAG: YciI family protein [Candidatus Dormibacteraeota bacterium]|nr:YciI family protein [Candidatus Dormibacteraeota bacterium]